MRVAVASSDGIMVNQHLGKATRFLIYETPGKLLETRTARPPSPGQDLAQEDHLARQLEVVADCAAVIAMRIGPGAREELLERGIVPVEAPGPIEAAVRSVLSRASG
ncbi:MAG: dinitrogenase iron-molybdenum cofactor biosynthesis protein [Chloroflexi bacterium]|nr:dinitrogenase iron-molybdenum cofactor biosynthesis protein [Chloroflexota bacterium]